MDLESSFSPIDLLEQEHLDNATQQPRQRQPRRAHAPLAPPSRRRFLGRGRGRGRRRPGNAPSPQPLSREPAGPPLGRRGPGVTWGWVPESRWVQVVAVVCVHSPALLALLK